MHRVPPLFVHEILTAFNGGQLDAQTAAQRLHVSPVANKIVTIVHHPQQGFWVIAHPPDPQNPVWPDVLAHQRL